MMRLGSRWIEIIDFGCVDGSLGAVVKIPDPNGGLAREHERQRNSELP
jgi:hypothetical protein